MKKQAIPNPTTGPRPTPLMPSKTVLSFDEIFQFIKAREGVNYTAVPDAGYFAIGLGHQIQPNEEYLLTARLTDEEILEIFKKDVDSIIKGMNKVIKVDLNKNQQLALISLRYNIGEGAFNRSTLLKLLNQKNYTGSALEFSKWRIAEGKINQGLVNRREIERKLFSKPV
jgi:lysozyme